MMTARAKRTTAIPRPPYLSDAWFRDHGVEDPSEVLARLRPEDDVMSPEVLRAIRPTHLSFSRSLLRRMSKERWRIRRVFCDVDAGGSGMIAYEIVAAGRTFHFAVSCRRSDGVDRTGRVCDTDNDLLGSLRDGPFVYASATAELEELRSRVWAGRTDNRTIGWTAANWSNRFLEHVLDRLSSGEQPDPRVLATGGGYVLRNAGWLGNGRFGAKSWLSFGDDHPFSYPYHCDLFALYLWREVGHDLVAEMARARAPDTAVPLSGFLGQANDRLD